MRVFALCGKKAASNALIAASGLASISGAFADDSFKILPIRAGSSVKDSWMGYVGDKGVLDRKGSVDFDHMMTGVYRGGKVSFQFVGPSGVFGVTIKSDANGSGPALSIDEGESHFDPTEGECKSFNSGVVCAVQYKNQTGTRAALIDFKFGNAGASLSLPKYDVDYTCHHVVQQEKSYINACENYNQDDYDFLRATWDQFSYTVKQRCIEQTSRTQLKDYRVLRGCVLDNQAAFDQRQAISQPHRFDPR